MSCAYLLIYILGSGEISITLQSTWLNSPQSLWDVLDIKTKVWQSGSGTLVIWARLVEKCLGSSLQPIWISRVKGEGMVLAGYLRPTDHADNVPIAAESGGTELSLLRKIDLGLSAKVLPCGSRTPIFWQALRPIWACLATGLFKLSSGYQNLSFLHEQPCSGWIPEQQTARHTKQREDVGSGLCGARTPHQYCQLIGHVKVFQLSCHLPQNLGIETEQLLQNLQSTSEIQYFSL